MLRLRELRNEKNLSQEQLGKLLNLQKAAISKYETGAVVPSGPILTRLSEIFGVSSDYILGNTDIRTLELSEEMENLATDFYEGVDVLMRANDELNPAQKKKMVEMMKLFLDTIKDK